LIVAMLVAEAFIIGKYYIALDDTFRIMNLDIKTSPATELLLF